MTVADSAEHDELREVVRGFLGQRSPSHEVRRLMEAGQSRDDEVWALLAGQLGLTGIAVPERFGSAVLRHCRAGGPGPRRLWR
jgi:alkylation response protein AidB-like acyl-CoA dehydrogenase